MLLGLNWLFTDLPDRFRESFHIILEVALTSDRRGGNLWRLGYGSSRLPVLTSSENLLLPLLFLQLHFFRLLLAQEVLLHARGALPRAEVIHLVRPDCLVSLWFECGILLL